MLPLGNDKNTIEVSRKRLSDIVQSSIVYPKLKSVEDKELKKVLETFTYECNDVECQFSAAVKLIEKSTIVESKGIRDISAKIVTGLNNVPTASTTAGFIIQSAGSPVVHIKNASYKESLDSDYIGLIDVTEVRRRLISESLVEKEARSVFVASALGWAVGTAGAAAVIGTLVKFFKRI